MVHYIPKCEQLNYNFVDKKEKYNLIECVVMIKISNIRKKSWPAAIKESSSFDELNNFDIRYNYIDMIVGRYEIMNVYHSIHLINLVIVSI